MEVIVLSASSYRRILLNAVTVAIVAATPSPAAEPTWLKFTSPNFEVYTSAGKGTGRDAIRHFEQIHQFFQELTLVKFDNTNRVRIIVFRSNKEYEPYKPNETAGAFYFGTNDRDYIIIGGNSKDDRQAAIHEYVHLLVKHSGVDLPVWLNEGFADLYSTLTPVGGKVKIGELMPGRLQVLRQNKWVDLETLTAVDHDSAHYNEKERVGIFYAESWALTHMLALSKPYHDRFRDFLVSLAKDNDPRAAFSQVYGKSLDDAYKDLKSYVNGDTFYAAIYDLKLSKLAEEPELAEASKFDVDLILAGMLSQSRGKAETAQQMLEELEKQNPNSWEVPETRGYLEYRAGRPDEARAYFSKAVERGSTNPQLYYDLARISSAQDDSSGAVLDLLERAVKLRKDFDEARIMLAYEYLRRDEYVNCLRHFAMLKKLDPDRAYRVYYAAAHAYSRINRPDDARANATKAKQFAKSPSEILDVEKLLSYLDRVEARDAAAAAPPEPVLEKPVELAIEFGDSVEPARPPKLIRKVADEPPAAGETPVETAPTESGGRYEWVRERDLQHVEGNFFRLDCLEDKARFWVEVGGEKQAFSIADPSTVAIEGTATDVMSFTCGDQKPRAVRVGFLPKQDSDLQTAGEVMRIEFQ